MKRKLPTIFLVCLLLGLLLMPVMALAVDEKAATDTNKPNDCCKVGRTVKLKEGSVETTFEKGCIIASGKNAYCAIGGKEYYNWQDTDQLKPGETCSGGTSFEKKWHEKWGMVCLLSTVYNITNWVFYLLMVIAVLMIIFGGATYMTAAGDPEKAGKGKSILTFAIIGLAIALIAKIIPSIVRVIVGM